MTSVPTVEGPAWTGKGLHESAGRYPLSVEGAVFRLVDHLLPGIITTTRQSRMYSVHALAWAEAHERGLDAEEAALFVRRCEVVVTAVHHVHENHLQPVRSAHGEERIEHFIDGGTLNVADGSRLGGMSNAGFANVYLGPAVTVGLLSPDRPPRAGERSNLGALREGLADLCSLADRDSIQVAELEAAAHLCLCGGAGAADGGHLRHVLFEAVDEDRHDDRNRRLTCGLLLEAIGDGEVGDVDSAFRERWGFGPPVAGATPEKAWVERGWRAAILRNYSVSAWRGLWWWLVAQLAEEPMTVKRLGRRLAAEVEQISLRELAGSLPARTDGERLLPAEFELEEEDWTPMRFLRMLALGAKRLEDLDRETVSAYVGSDLRDLGPGWVAIQLEEHAHHGLDVFARDLVEILVRRARRVALGKTQLVDGRPRLPSRVRDRDGLLSARGEEGAGEVSLRIRSLTEILIGLGALTRDQQGTVSATPLGRELRDRTA